MKYKPTVVKPENDFKSGQNLSNLEWKLEGLREGGVSIVLDLSDVIFMDTGSMRLVFDYYSIVKKIVQPKSSHVIERYNDWLDSKKGLVK